jgi:hypothetical protein
MLLYNPDNGVTRNFMPHLWQRFPHESLPKFGNKRFRLVSGTQPNSPIGLEVISLIQSAGFD